MVSRQMLWPRLCSSCVAFIIFDFRFDSVTHMASIVPQPDHRLGQAIFVSEYTYACCGQHEKSSGSHDHTARVWNLVMGREPLILSGHTGTISSVAVSPDGQRIVTGSFDQTARVWEAATGRLVRTIKTPTSRISSVAFSPDSRRIVICGWEPQTVWELATLIDSLSRCRGTVSP
jgi:WD40 repeat protein